jgi:hypothetical protein
LGRYQISCSSSQGEDSRGTGCSNVAGRQYNRRCQIGAIPTQMAPKTVYLEGF